MAEPWLDSLSEDWNSQPASSPRSLPSFGTPSASTRSRIPRYTPASKKNVPSSLRRPNAAVTSGSRILSERSFSDINIPTHSPLRRPSSKPHLKSGSDASSSIPSDGSVIRQSSPIHKPSQSPGVKQDASIHIPEWKKLVLNAVKDPTSQADLFTAKPLGLQNIFENPDENSSDDLVLPGPNLSFLQGFETMPSSPPPWPKGHRGPSSHLDNVHSHRAGDGLDSILEQQEDELEDVLQPSRNDGTQDDVHDGGDCESKIAQQSTKGGLRNVKWISQVDGTTDESLCSDSNTNLRNEEADVPEQNALNAGCHKQIRARDLQSVRSSSSMTGGFSPVFISKHNTIDGRVDYAAVDTSQPETRELLRSYNTASPKDEEGLHPLNIGSMRSSFQFPAKTLASGLSNIHSNEQVERGTYTNSMSDGDRRAALSSPRLSIVPSDSVSQVYICEKDRQTSFPSYTNEFGYSQNHHQETNKHGSLGTTVDVQEPGEIVPDLDHARRDSKMDQIIQASIRLQQEHSPTNFQAGNWDQGHESSDTGLFVQSTFSSTESGSAPSVETIVHRADAHGLRQPQTQLDGALARLTTPEPDAKSELKEDACKRSVGSSAKGPTPKRRRTLGQADLLPAVENISQATFEHHRLLQAMIGKRKDARYENDYTFCDPEILAKRQILRPRVPSVDMQHTVIGKDEPADPESPMEESKTKNISGSDAAMRILAIRGNGGLIRQPSVSTKDYLDEAMKIMECIRFKKMAPSELSSLEESMNENVESIQILARREFTPQTFSRPPSREGVVSVWRSKGLSISDAQVATRLQKYQEKQDETLLMSSLLDAVNAVSEEEEEEFPEDDSNDSSAHESVQIRIFPPLHEQEQVQSPVKTHSSQQSTDSGKTVQTTLSQRSRTLPTIAPEQVSHLLHAETNGMRYDAERNTWVKAKRRDPSFNISSSTGTEDDPFLHIPDLSVGASDAQSSLPKPVGVNQGHFEPRLAQKPTINAPLEQRTHPHFELEEEVHDLEILQSDQLQSDVVEDQNNPQNSHFPQKMYESNGTYDEDMSDEPHHDNPMTDVWKPRLIRETTKTADIWPSDDIETEEHATPELVPRASETVQHHEVSLIQTNPDGRRMSLTFSVSTPLQVSRHLPRPTPFGAGLLSSNIWQSMSPLSEFTTHQDDARHLQARRLLKNVNVDQVTSVVAKASSGATVLVEKITDAEPDEPDWDFIESLTLESQSLDNLHMLDEFCPRIIDLDVTANCLQHLDGAPSGIRHLRIAGNQLSSLTSWTHLRNLQYLDISNNSIESLDALSELIHLRELKADNNAIVDVEGIFDLDGLLSVSLNSNQLRHVDFTGSNLKRLESVSLENNSIQSVSGLHDLPALKRLDLNQNLLEAFPGKEISPSPFQQLRSLRLANNNLTGLNVSGFPMLEYLDVDSNNLSTISGTSNLEKLQILSMRSQNTPVTEKNVTQLVDLLYHCSRLTHLYISGNALTHLLTSSSLSLLQPLLNLSVLEAALCSISTIPPNFATIFPNIQTLNLNFNALKDLRPLRSMRSIRRLYLSGNRISRLRRTISVLETQSSTLEHLDARENPLVNGFYHPSSFGTSGLDIAPITPQDTKAKEEWWSSPPELQHLLPSHPRLASKASINNSSTSTSTSSSSPNTATATDEDKYFERLDEDTKLKRRVYELLLASNSFQKLKTVDGRPFGEREKAKIMDRSDGCWSKLVELGIVEMTS